MENLTARILTVLLPSVLLLAGAAQAQYEPHTLLVTVPFEFTAGAKTFPAGDYSIVSTAPDRLSVRDSRATFWLRWPRIPRGRQTITAGRPGLRSTPWAVRTRSLRYG
jgi:hypothetical protein